MNLEQFLKILNDLETEINRLQKLSELGLELENKLIVTIFEMLNAHFSLKKNEYIGTDLEYFIFELDFGKKYKDGCFIDANGKNIDLSSAENLYKYLTNYK